MKAVVHIVEEIRDGVQACARCGYVVLDSTRTDVTVERSRIFKSFPPGPVTVFSAWSPVAGAAEGAEECRVAGGAN